jgi:predicted AAA+ superfamily ATPase
VLLDSSPDLRAAASLDPEYTLTGPAPRLIDEWQLVPDLWNVARHMVDRAGKDGLFIFTGSATPTDDHTRHSGAGRFSRLRMRPMSLFESGLSSGDVSLAGLLGGDRSRGQDSGKRLTDIVEAVCRGGWPGNHDRPLAVALSRMRDYVREIQSADLRLADGTSRDPLRLQACVKALARNVSTEVRMSTIARDSAAFAGLEVIRDETVAGYLNALERVMIVENQPAWRPHLRSRAAARVAPKRLFVDPSVAVAALGARPEDLLDDIEFLGFLFESLVVRDLRVLASPLDGEVLHYRDSSDLEVDAVVSFGYRRWAAFEIKLAATGEPIEHAAKSLLRFARTVDPDREGEPALLGIITGSGSAYVRRDGVHVIPAWCLGP